MSKVLVTGAAGFIGFHLSNKLLQIGFEVYGIDNMNNYYDPNLKNDRLTILRENKNFHFNKMDICDKEKVFQIFDLVGPDYVVNLAAQAGVRYSLENPYAYIDSNVVGFLNILEACRTYTVKHLVYASSSSVYGGNHEIPFSTEHNVDHPVSLYAATKKSNELMAHTYSHLYNIPTTGLRFFTVYGPWGRPDMAYYSFTKSIINNEKIKVYNYGKMERDFTYIDDIVNGIVGVMNKIPTSVEGWSERENGISTSFAPYRIYNIGNNNPVQLKQFIKVLEDSIGMEADKVYMEMQPGDVLKTYADIVPLINDINFKPSIEIEEGIGKFVEWYRTYYNM